MIDLEFIDGEVVEATLVDELEVELGVNFPKDYKDFVIQHNGAYVIPGAYRIGNTVESINNFYSIKKSYYFKDEDLPEGIIPFARDAGGNKICFDFSAEDKVRILFWDHGSPVNDGLDLSYVAESFTDFLGMLFHFDE